MSKQDVVSCFDEIYNSTQKEVLAFITVKCGNTADINDIFQDTYMELYKLIAKRGTNYITNSRALVYRIARRKLARHYSAAERLRRVIPMSSVNEFDDEPNIADLAIEGASLEDIAVNQVMLDTVRKLIKEKPEVVKKVFYLFYDVGLTIPEISKALSMSESNVKHKLYRTLKELREILN